MVGEGPSTPYLATVPLVAAPRRRRRWVVPTAVGVGLTVALVATVLFAVPLPAQRGESLVLTNSGSILSPVGQTVSFPHRGTLDLSWRTVSGRNVTFSILDPEGMTLYSSGSSHGSVDLTVQGGAPYTFEIYDWLPETVSASGTLRYSAPML